MIFLAELQRVSVSENGEISIIVFISYSRSATGLKTF